MNGALLSAVLSLWQSSHLAKSQIHISQIITTYNVIPLQQNIVKLKVSHYIIYMSLRHKQTYCVESALPNRKLAVRVINHEPIVQKTSRGSIFSVQSRLKPNKWGHKDLHLYM